MPIYEYRCENGHEFEAFQSMSDDPISECIECGASAQRVLSPPAVHFKGSGFYTTDYARKGKKAAESSATTPSDSSGSDSSSSKDGASKGSDSSSSKADSAKSTSSKSD